MTKIELLDFAERVLATAGEAGVGYAAVTLADLEPQYGVLITAAAAVVKNFLGRFLGDKSTGSWLPKHLSPSVPKPVDDTVSPEGPPLIIGG